MLEAKSQSKSANSFCDLEHRVGGQNRQNIQLVQTDQSSHKISQRVHAVSQLMHTFS